MNKNRLEALSDGVFSIIMTLLIFNVTVPLIAGTPTEPQLDEALAGLIPLFTSYFVSFAVLAMFWISHNFFYGSFTRSINRKLVLLNMLYLSLLAFIPFSAHLLGTYPLLPIALFWYGTNLFLIGTVASVVLHYAIYSHEIDTSHVTPQLLNQARVRSLITPVSTLIGLVCVYFSRPFALFFFAFPVVFNLIPGSLEFTQRVFKIEI